MCTYKYNQKNKKTCHPAQRPVKSATVALSEDRILRPPNCFILFRQHVYPLLAEQYGGRQSEISKQCGELWRNLSPDERRHWEIQAGLAKLEHKTMYPDYVFRPRVKRAARVESTPPSFPSSASSGSQSAQVSPSPISSPEYFDLLDMDDPIPRISKGRSTFYSLPPPTPYPLDSASLSLDAYNACDSVYSPVQSASASPSSDWAQCETSPLASTFESTIHDTAPSSSGTDDWLEMYLNQPEDAEMGASDSPYEVSTSSPSSAASTPSSFDLLEDVSFAGSSLVTYEDVAML